MDNVERFIDLYKQLEAAIRTTYGINKKRSVMFYLTEQSKFSKYKDDILLCCDTRNLIQHGKDINDGFIVQPTEQMISFIRSLIFKVKNRQKCVDAMIPISEVYRLNMEGGVSDAMKKIQEKNYTHVPILRDRKVVGVFDENALFCYLADNKTVSIDGNLTFEMIKKYLAIDGRENESFLFAKKNDYIDEIEERINAAFKKLRRVGMIFITNTGDKNGKLQGILTPWDIIASYKEI